LEATPSSLPAKYPMACTRCNVSIRNYTVQKAWMDFDVTVQEGLEELETLCSMEVILKGMDSCQQIPTPNETAAQLLNAIHVRLPKVLPSLGAVVVTRKKSQDDAPSLNLLAIRAIFSTCKIWTTRFNED